MVAKSQTKRRQPLSRERLLETAIALADAEGIDALTMRHLAERLDVEAMSLYYHVANKEAILDGVVDALLMEVSDEIGGFEPPDEVNDWQLEVRRRIVGARLVMMRHKWAPSVIESRTTIGPAVLFYLHGILGVMIEGGFSYDLAHHALHALGSRALGFTQELFEPGSPEQESMNEESFNEMAEHLPYLVGMMAEIMHDGPDDTLGWCDDETEFAFGLDIVLEGLEQRRLAEA
ncbi:MAG: TetR/AcrR family transcriptional regulator C-terminal domain-containing protein [Acidimicrobiia bacterium]